MEQEIAMWIKKEETDVVHSEPGPLFLQDPLKLEEPILHVKQEVEFKLDVDDPEQKFLGDPLGDYWSSDHINEDLKPNLGWDENENNNAVENTLLHTILEAESECCPPPLLVPKEKELDCVKCEIERTTTQPLVPFLPKEVPSFGTLAIDHQQTTQIREEETDCAPDEPGLMDCVKCEIERTTTQPLVPFLPKEEPECVKCEIERTTTQPLVPFQPKEEPDCVKCEIERTTTQPLVPFLPKEEPSFGTLAIDHQQTTQIREEETDCAPDEPGLMDCVKCEIERTTTQPLVPFLPKEEPDCVKCEIERTTTQPLVPFQPKEEPVVASTSYASTSTRMLQSNERHDFQVEETLSEGVSHNELEIGSEESTHLIVFREGEEEEKEEEDSLSAPRLKCCLRGNKYQTFICSFCLQSFTSKYRLIMHVFVHIDGVELPKYVCKSCAEVFPSNARLKEHLKISETEQDSSADKAEKFDCSGKTFTHLGTPKSNSLIHMATSPNNCDICGKSFTHLSKLKIHALIHSGKRPHKCDICGKSFTQLSNLKRHGLIHTGTKPHKCNTCGKSFTQLTDLKRHSLIHTGTSPHKCDICGKSYTQSGTLKTHSLIHTGSKPHKCDICGKFFTRLNHLKSHSLIHTGRQPHKCDNCGKSFTRLSHLKCHSLIHTGTRPHKCDICSKSFTRLSHLKSHSLIHTETKSHKCDICGKYFTQLINLKSHVLIHTDQFPQL